MKKLLEILIIGIFAYSLTACRHSSKDPEIISNNAAPVETKTDDIIKNVFTDNYGEQMEVALNNSKNTITIHLDGKTYELKKNEDLPDYTASNAEYLYSNIRGNITFLKRNVDMVLFHHKKDDKQPGPTKMASY
ncbi:hypothetical protein [Chryseobacterium polytrichastri]|uniref:Uncharacterized protein n=1 Tax=Chryseobacterium polytrichastri TaxID=1302687 RepID=A0A1M6WAZ3_9FLAO|nr:hypothetical protein [Chryseobacterium polytrichastri]SHK90779.1 hypothetical protein SAMN05444267_100944 [Chryseobacterium polytrichastri]